MTSVAASTRGAAFTPIAGTSRLALGSGFSGRIGKLHTFQWLITILATSFEIARLPYFHARRKLLANTAAICTDNTSERVTAWRVRAVTPFAVVADRVIDTLLILAAFQTGTTSNTETAVIPAGHALGKFHAVFSAIGFGDTGQACATTGNTAVARFRLARGNVSALHFTCVILLAHKATAARRIGAVAKLKFTSWDRLLALFHESILFRTDESVAAFCYSTFSTGCIAGSSQRRLACDSRSGRL